MEKLGRFELRKGQLPSTAFSAGLGGRQLPSKVPPPPGGTFHKVFEMRGLGTGYRTDLPGDVSPEPNRYLKDRGVEGVLTPDPGELRTADT